MRALIDRKLPALDTILDCFSLINRKLYLLQGRSMGLDAGSETGQGALPLPKFEVVDLTSCCEPPFLMCPFPLCAEGHLVQEVWDDRSPETPDITAPKSNARCILSFSVQIMIACP